jgi:hypothetical protein
LGKHLKPFLIPFSSRFRTVFVFVRLIQKQSGKNGKVVGRYGIFPSRFQPYLSELCGRTTPSLPPRPHMSSSADRTQYRLCSVPTTQCQALSLLRCRSRPSSQRCQRPPLGTDAAAPQKFAALQAGCLSPLVSSPQAAAPHQSPPPQRPTPASSPGIEGHYPVVLPTPPVPAGETPPLFLNLVPLPDRAPRLVHGEHEQGKRFFPTPFFFSIIEQ